MRNKPASLVFWLTALGVAILFAGLAAAYLVRSQAHANAGARYRLVGGEAYLEQSADSKQDAGELQRYGGNAAIIIASYQRKLHALFHGEGLSNLLAILAVLLAACCFRAAWHARDSD